MQGGANTGKVSQRNGCRVGQKGQPIPFNREDTHLKPAVASLVYKCGSIQHGLYSIHVGTLMRFSIVHGIVR